jgi:hypothetical protein
VVVELELELEEVTEDRVVEKEESIG